MAPGTAIAAATSEARLDLLATTNVAGARGDDDRPNVLLIVTDDQRWDTLFAMRNVRQLMAQGVEFTNAHVVTPLCCPARAAILSGQYAHTNGVYGSNNNEPFGGFDAFDDSTTVATVMHDAGYQTALIGKYLNGYGEPSASKPARYIPPGWDEWHAISRGAEAGDNHYYSYELNENGTIVDYGRKRRDYLTDVTGQKVVDFIDSSHGGRPWFAEWTPTAPHAAAIPEADHAHDWDSIARWRPKSYMEANIRDKPAWMQSRSVLSRDRRQALDQFRIDQLNTLQSVDDWIGAMLDAAGPNTIVIFTSDNGYLWGEHRLTGKNVPYEEATRVPFVVAGPGIGADVSDALVANIDIAPTIAEAGGTAIPGADGLSMLGMLHRGDWTSWRDAHLIEQKDGAGNARGVPAWCQLRGDDYVFTHYADGEREYYNLANDPFQLNNRWKRLRTERKSVLVDRLRALCKPRPPGMPPW